MSLWRRELVELHLLPVPRDRDGDEVSPVAGVVAALSARLDEQPLKPGTRVACIVPGPFARYLIVPWNALMLRAAARRLFAEHCFREVYGELNDGWIVRVDEPSYGRPSLACAMDGALLNALSTTAAARGVVVRSIQPALMHAANAFEKRLSTGFDWIVVPDGVGVTLLLMEDGRPTWVSTVASTAATIDNALAREWFAIGRDPAPARVHVAEPTLFAVAQGTPE